MKTEKKPNDPGCLSAPLVSVQVKEETDSDNNRVKVKEESTANAIATGQIIKSKEPIPGPGGQGGTTEANNDVGEHLTDQVALNSLGSVVESSCSGDNQNPTNVGTQAILNPIKQENISINSTAELSATDCGPSVRISRDGVPPMASNVLTKSMGTNSGGGESQYMQQQSQIFVFSTQMANKGAEMVLQGQFLTIIAFHAAQPSTKKFLEKHPNKMMQYRPNLHQQWMNNFPIKPKNAPSGQGIGPSHQMHQQQQQQPMLNQMFPAEQPPDLPALDPNASAFWNEPTNVRNSNNPLGNPESSLDDANIDVPCLVPNSPNTLVNPSGSANASINQGAPNLLGGPQSPLSGGLQPSLQGVKVPDENLTPQQRQHREEQLATIRKMQMMLFPEQKDIPGGSIDPSQVTPQMPNCPQGGLPPVSVSNQCGPAMVDWHKMQNPFVDGKPKQQGGVGNAGIPIRGPGATGVPRNQGPPPPYHQTTRSASVPIAIQSPNPSSPNNPTSNLSLPSPRASSALNSPADCNRQFQLGQRPGHVPGQSPTSQDSPNPSGNVMSGPPGTRLNHSNPGTPVSHALSALSPSGTPHKDLSMDYPPNQANVDNMFCRSLPSMQAKPPLMPSNVNSSGVKEPNLMPVPSPQQIQYLNTFDGQELTIQKQPNTSLKDGNISSNTQAGANPDIGNRMLPSNMDNNNQFSGRADGGTSPSIESANRGFGMLHSPHTPHTPHTPGNVAPHTPIDPGKQCNKSSAQSSPASHNASFSDAMGPPKTILASPNTKSENSPLSKDLQQQHQMQQLQQQHQQQQQQSPGPGLMPPMTGFPCNRLPNANVGQPSDNVPLNPSNMVNRMGNQMMQNSFDPITSLAQMSQQLTNATPNSALGNENSNMHSGNPNMMPPFNSQNPQQMHQIMSQMQQPAVLNEINGCHMVGGPQNDPIDVAGLCMGSLGVPPASFSPTPHTGSPGMPNKMNIHHQQQQPHPGMMPQQNYPGGMPPHMQDAQQQQQRLMPPGHPHQQIPHVPMHPSQQQQQMHMHGGSSGNPYNGANIQVKPSAPNTIQYLPARPNVGHAPRGPPSLDFLQRFATPNQGGMDTKMGSPSVHLQYFPNGCMPNNMGPGSGMHPGSPAGCGMPPNQRPMDPQPLGNMNTMHQTMRPTNIGPSGGGVVRQQPNIMRMQHHMVGGGVFPGNVESDKLFPPEMVRTTGPPTPGMFNGPPGPNKPPSNINPMGGPGPDTSQPLPSSMGGPPSNFKNSPFMSAGSSMNDPNYLQQFHNFQQQLYATGTRGSGPPPHPNMHSQPNPHQQFFMPK